MTIGLNITVPSARDLRDLVEAQIVVKHAAQEVLGTKLVSLKNGSDSSERHFSLDADASNMGFFENQVKRRLGSSYRIQSDQAPVPVLNIALLPA